MCSEFGLVLVGPVLCPKCGIRNAVPGNAPATATTATLRLRRRICDRMVVAGGFGVVAVLSPSPTSRDFHWTVHDMSHEPPGTVIMGAAGNDLFCRWNRQMLMAEKSLAHLQRQQASKCSCVVPSSNLPHLFPNGCISSAELVEAFRRDMFSQPNQNQLERASLQRGYFVTTKISVPRNQSFCGSGLHRT